jgi:gluconolactonase
MTNKNPLDGFTVDRATITTIGQDLQRPECILAERDGTLWSADARGGVMRLDKDGSQTFIGQKADERFGMAATHNAEAFEAKLTQGTLPNGMAFTADGSLLIANFGTDALEKMTRDGLSQTLFDKIDGQAIGKVNFVLRDSKNRIWITISRQQHAAFKTATSLFLMSTACEWLPMVFTLPMRFGWMNLRSGSTSSKRLGPTFHGCA